MDAVKRTHPADWLEFQNNFEMKKCDYDAYTDEDITIRLPLSFYQVFKEQKGESFDQHLKKFGNSYNATFDKR